MTNLYDHQKKIINNITKDLRKLNATGLIFPQIPVGTGKSLIVINIIKKYPGKTMLISLNKTLKSQFIEQGKANGLDFDQVEVYTAGEFLRNKDVLNKEKKYDLLILDIPKILGSKLSEKISKIKFKSIIKVEGSRPSGDEKIFLESLIDKKKKSTINKKRITVDKLTKVF